MGPVYTQLARVELQEALRALYTTHPGLTLAAPPTYAKRPGHRAVTDLTVTLG